MQRRSLILGVLALGALATTPALAQMPQPTAVRGAVTAVAGNQLTVKGADGKPVTVALTPDWSVQVTKPIAVTAIVPGSFVGTAEMPGKNGVGLSLEVHVFPPGVKIGEGHYRWDLKKGAMMTNGTVGKVTAGAKGRELEISYPTGKRKVVVPPNVPVVQIVNGERSMIKPGAKVFLLAFPNPAGGGLITGAVAVGENGSTPPM
jgi:hypothetical protein